MKLAKQVNRNPKVEYISILDANEIERYPHFGEVICKGDARMLELVSLVKDCGGQEFLSFLDMDSSISEYNFQELDSTIYELTIRNIVAVDCSKYQL
ncbi:MAG: hypothetical protein IJD47_03160 [Clostridia bacterium]|nr:hypothetical protein [Clostridia bacterium]